MGFRGFVKYIIVFFWLDFSFKMFLKCFGEFNGGEMMLLGLEEVFWEDEISGVLEWYGKVIIIDDVGVIVFFFNFIWYI